MYVVQNHERCLFLGFVQGREFQGSNGVDVGRRNVSIMNPVALSVQDFFSEDSVTVIRAWPEASQLDGVQVRCDLDTYIRVEIFRPLAGVERRSVIRSQLHPANRRLVRLPNHDGLVVRDIL